ncbi:MAG: response regulator transcription factor [Gemmatimonadetes bacterium]|jgi:DNA-binding response OmpR family regulator|nr:response regulator transcription factor [Gemmatimonadota bacterium]
MITLLVVEDDTAMARGLAHNLEFDGYNVLLVRDAEDGLKMLEEQAIDLIILDVMLPNMSGFDLCRTLRSRGIRTPIIMLTARGEEKDRVLGLDMGADDYLTKPFSIRELLARIKAVLRRTDAPGADVERFTFGEVELDFQRFEARVGEEQIHLSPKEFTLLKFFIQNEGRVVPRNELLDSVWGYDAFPSTRTIDNHVAGLRAKLEIDPAHPQHILTVHGVGYKFVP